MILDLDDIAALWKVDRAYARDTLVKQPDFPAPAKGSTRKYMRWLRKDVLAYLGIEE